ncbi:MAG: magnesium transporter, partial [Armatimonadetes bacterium]|nr:magnesium transporter [Armatimonadota bacterium]
MNDEAIQTAAEQLEELLENGKVQEAAALLLEALPSDAAQAITDLPPQLRETALRALPPERAADIVEELPDDVAASAIEAMRAESAAAILHEMQTDEEADVLQDVSDRKAEEILGRLDREEAEMARELLEYPEDTAGGLMQKEFIGLPVGFSASEAVRHLRSRAAEYADFPASYLYVLDERERLLGVLSLRSLLLCDPDAPIRSLMRTDPVSVEPSVEGEELAKVFRRRHFLAMPVVHADDRMLGIVTQEDALRFEKEESDEDLLQVSGIPSGEELRETPFLSRALRRLSWLLLKIVLNLGVAAVVALHEGTLQMMAALAVLLPVVSDLGGSAGSQAVAVSIRELSLERVRPRDFWRVLGTEAAIGAMNGIVLGLVVGAAAFLWKGNPALGLLAGFAISSSTIIAVAFG